MTTAERVTVIGLGAMGSALASAFIAAGHEVTVWNRSPNRMKPLVALGAVAAASPAEAIAASPLTMMCVLGYDVADAILAELEVTKVLEGRTIVQATGGKPDDVVAQRDRVHALGGHFLAAGIMAYPSTVGKEGCMVIYAGDPVFESHRTTLLALGGRPLFLGEDPRHVPLTSLAVSGVVVGGLGLFYETSAAVEQMGLNVSSVLPVLENTLSELLHGIRDGARRIATRDFSDSSATIDMLYDGRRNVAETFRASGVEPHMTEAMFTHLKVARERGYGADDLARLIETIQGKG